MLGKPLRGKDWKKGEDSLDKACREEYREKAEKKTLL